MGYQQMPGRPVELGRNGKYHIHFQKGISFPSYLVGRLIEGAVSLVRPRTGLKYKERSQFWGIQGHKPVYTKSQKREGKRTRRDAKRAERAMGEYMEISDPLDHYPNQPSTPASPKERHNEKLLKNAASSRYSTFPRYFH